MSMVPADANCKNLKGSDETGVEGVYRLTKITGPVTVTITTQPTGSGEPTEPEEPAYTPVVTGDTRVTGYYDETGFLKLELAVRYNSGAINEDGGSESAALPFGLETCELCAQSGQFVRCTRPRSFVGKGFAFFDSLRRRGSRRLFRAEWGE